ncbi:MAG TPA: beta-N-acetylhexosaminidase [Phnomibacter sp.]|nr:beta-N-acetylhexosaminidase [Phnomibacter sp.]
MNKLFVALFALCISGATLAQQSNIAIIPQPVSVNPAAGFFQLPDQLDVDAPRLPELKETLRLLQQRLSAATGSQVQLMHQPAGMSAIMLTINTKANPLLGNEGYELKVDSKHVLLSANKPAGLYYGVQTLLQLFPKEIESNTLQKNVQWKIPCVDIVDYPRFGWRGLMLDVARHFFTKQEVKDYIDKMARYKFNTLHWHLADDEGWRLEIKSLPKLTSIGAWRVEKTGYFGDMSKPLASEPRSYGGFYTQEDVKEIIAYAQERFVNILPEIDVPGHSLATIAAYPELSCTPGAENYTVRSGEKIMEWYGNGKFSALVDNSLCPANEKVYSFLNKVFGEVAALFPFDYIHIGGDECAHNFWERNPQILALMQKEKLKDMHELQSYFTKRVVGIVGTKGKKVIGWDEILEGGLVDGAAVMSWRGEKGGIAATQLKHEVVMSPTTFSYIDYMQGDGAIESRVYAKLRLKKAYEFDPVPVGADEKYIKGGQANLWTEQVYNMRYAQYMTWPRAFATIESVWTPKNQKNWEQFTKRVETHFGRMDVQQVKYAPSMFEPEFTVSKDDKGDLWVTMTKEIDDIELHYSFDNSFPDQFYPTYQQAVKVPKDAAQLKVVSYRGNEQKGRFITISVEDLKKRVPASK